MAEFAAVTGSLLVSMIYVIATLQEIGNREVFYATKEEQDRLIDTMIKTEPPYGCNDFRLQLFIEMYSGMRMGEINALKPDDIDFEEGVIHVRSIISTGLDGKPFVK